MMLAQVDVESAGQPAAHTTRATLDIIADIRAANDRLLAACSSAQRRLEEAEEANRQKDEFLATVAHELRTPLNAVLGWTRLLELKHLPPGGVEHALTAIARSSSALAHMIDDLLDTSRILNGRLRIAQDPVDVVAVAQEALDAVEPLAAAKNVRLSFDADPARRVVAGDAGRLQQVVWNLLANAIKFTPPGGCVSVSVRSSDDQLEVRVIDTGDGISAGLLPHVFERYRQGAGVTTARHTGLGLGLGIVLRLVELHRGAVEAVSAGEGRGATFTVRLPLP